jgi:hypothetical protein
VVLPSSWWNIPRLDAGQKEPKTISDVIDCIGHGTDVEEPQLRRLGFHPTAPRLVFTIQYRRKVDQKLYTSYVGGELSKNVKTGKYSLTAIPFTPEPPPSPGYAEDFEMR